ncbi:CBS domain-containing protein, partial [Xanthomonas citri pv. citri]
MRELGCFHRNSTNLRSSPMRAHQIMTRSVISVTPDTSIVEAANIMLK